MVQYPSFSSFGGILCNLVESYLQKQSPKKALQELAGRPFVLGNIPGLPCPSRSRHGSPVPAGRRKTVSLRSLIANRTAKRFRATRKSPRNAISALLGPIHTENHASANSSPTSPRSRSFSIVLRLVVTSCRTAYCRAASEPTTTSSFLARENPV